MAACWDFCIAGGPGSAPASAMDDFIGYFDSNVFHRMHLYMCCQPIYAAASSAEWAPHTHTRTRIQKLWNNFLQLFNALH